MEIYEKTVEVLGPQVQKLMAFMYFQVSLFSSVILYIILAVLILACYTKLSSHREIMRCFVSLNISLK